MCIFVTHCRSVRNIVLKNINYVCLNHFFVCLWNCSLTYCSCLTKIGGWVRGCWISLLCILVIGMKLDIGNHRRWQDINNIYLMVGAECGAKPYTACVPFSSSMMMWCLLTPSSYAKLMGLAMQDCNHCLHTHKKVYICTNNICYCCVCNMCAEECNYMLL